jgi:dolichol-phosphate mannosyltransferase
MTDLSVVIPVHNEESNIQPLIDEVRRALDGKIDFELIYVNDGSSDGTLNRLRKARENCPQLRIISHVESVGQSSAVRTGIEQAVAPWIATLDGDGQNDPADIPALYETLLSQYAAGVQLVNGYRKKRRDTFIKRISSKLANGIRSYLLKDQTPDTGCGLKLFSREAYLALPFFDHMHRFMPAMIQRGGGKVVSVEVHHRERERGSSHYGFFDRLWVGIFDLLGVAWLQRRVTHPVVDKEESG